MPRGYYVNLIMITMADQLQEAIIRWSLLGTMPSSSPITEHVKPVGYLQEGCLLALALEMQKAGWGCGFTVMILNESIKLWAVGKPKWKPKKDAFWGLKRWLSLWEYWLLLHRTQVQFLAPTWQLTAIHYIPGEPIPFSDLRMHVVHRHICRQSTETHFFLMFLF